MAIETPAEETDFVAWFDQKHRARNVVELLPKMIDRRGPPCDVVAGTGEVAAENSGSQKTLTATWKWHGLPNRDEPEPHRLLNACEPRAPREDLSRPRRRRWPESRVSLREARQLRATA